MYKGMNQEELKAFYKAQKDQMIANKVTNNLNTLSILTYTTKGILILAFISSVLNLSR